MKLDDISNMTFTQINTLSAILNDLRSGKNSESKFDGTTYYDGHQNAQISDAETFNLIAGLQGAMPIIVKKKSEPQSV